MDDSTLLAAIGFGFLVVASTVVLTAAPLAGLVTGHGWVSSTKGVPETILLTVTRGPAAAYDPAPPTWAFWLVVVLFLAILIVAVVFLLRSFGGKKNLGGAQWGGVKTEKELAVDPDPVNRPDQITAGRGQLTKKILAAEPNISATVFGPPGSVKTTGLVLGNAAEWRGPLVVTTVKAADLDVIYESRRHLGPVYVVAPAGLPGRKTARWSPVDYAKDPKSADRMAEWLANASASGHDPRAAPWIDQARGILKGLLLAANMSGGGIRSFREWLALGKDGVEHVKAILEPVYPEVALDYSRPWVTLHEDGIGSIQFTLNVIASVYRDEEVRATASGTDFTVEQLLDKNATVCLVAAPSDAERYAPLLTAIIASIIHGAEQRYNQTGKPVSPGLGVLVDEAGNMLRYPQLPGVLTTGRGMGITVLTVWHDLSQLRTRFGHDAANTILSASGLRMLLPGCGDPETLRHFSGIYGRTYVERTTTSTGRGQSSSSTTPVEADLAPIHELMQLAKFTAIAQYSNLPPVKVDMRITWRDEDLLAWLARPVPGPSLTKSAPTALEASDV
ncbi:type IV secretory system conjugative DNA transfer family protein [Streptomyces sp. NBC_01601]|uniref:type IV secretory system conjugative DNA transfer family protein n=1 Tax=Streptomyces sp. NBC_01601 TaxID=2975892 RepID=UPI002E29B0C8|nr:type IV secretory system conjugative DNA transfer family protein [Streptomyces sp. NBC_01601]